MRQVPLSGEGPYPVRALASVLLLFGAPTVAHGSGFLAVLVAGIVLGDERAPCTREIERFHAALASLGEIVAFVVVFSVVVQASLAPTVARLLRLPMRVVELEPWSLGVRLRDEPAGVQLLTIRTGSPADGCTIRDLDDLPADAWTTLLVRTGQTLPVRGDAVLGAGDDVTILARADQRGQLAAAFERASPD